MCELGNWDVVCLGSRDLGLCAVLTELSFLVDRVGGSQETIVINKGLCYSDLGTSE